MTWPTPFPATEPGDDGLDLLTPAHRLRDTVRGREILAASGRPVSAARVDKKREKHNGRVEPSRIAKYDRAEFIGWDGEGVDVQGRHRYVILANSKGDAVVNPNGITTAQVFDTLLRTAQKYPRAIHVIFAGGYDVNMWLRGSITRKQAGRLSDIGWIDLKVGDQRYRVRYHPRHEFYVARVEGWDEKRHRLIRRGAVTVWDVFGSFQCGFVKACQKLLPESDLADLQQIQDMKGRRSVFRLEDMPEMLDYCRAELRALVRLAEVDRDNFDHAGFKTSRFDGAGAKASAVLRTKRVGDHKCDTPDELQIPIRGAYAGGRIESYKFGYYEGPIWTVDLRSAYPWAATFLPSLANGRWEYVAPDTHRSRRRPGTPDEFSVWHVSYTADNLTGIHPFYWRGPGGNICYPAVTSGWYWAPEVAEAVRAHPGRVRVDCGWVFHPTSDEKPFSFVPELFHIREALEKARKGQGVALKFALNSIYGKLAQQIGSKDGKPPRWHQLEWAGWITSKTRATVHRIAHDRLDNLVDIATDGVCFYGSEPDAELTALEGTGLGQLEIARYDAGCWVQSGVYWLHDGDGWVEPKVRGIGSPEPCRLCRAPADRECDHRRPLSMERFLRLWESRDFGAVPVDVTRFRGLVTSAISEERWREWCQWVTEARDIAAGARGKRLHLPDDCAYCRRGGPPATWSTPSPVSIVDGTGLHSTLPLGGGSESALHSLEWESSLGRTTEDTRWLDTLDEDDTEAE